MAEGITDHIWTWKEILMFKAGREVQVTTKKSMIFRSSTPEILSNYVKSVSFFRYREVKRSAFSQSALHPDIAPEFIQYLLAYGQSQARALVILRE